MATVFRPGLFTRLWRRDAGNTAQVSQPSVTSNRSVNLLRSKDRFPPGTSGSRPEYDRPNPQRHISGHAVWSQAGVWQNRLVNLLRSKDRFPPGIAGSGPDYAWPNPQYRAVYTQSNVYANLLGTLLAVTVVAAPVGKSVQANPARQLVYPSIQTQSPNLLTTTLGSLSVTFDVILGGELSSTQSIVFRQPLVTHLWQQDGSAANRAQTQGQPLTLTSIVSVTFDGVIGGELLGPIVAPQIAQSDWPNPQRGISRYASITAQLNGQPLILGTLRGQDILPTGGPDYDWPNPVRSPSRIQSITAQGNGRQSLVFSFILPVGGPDYDWPNPQRGISRYVATTATLNGQPLVLGTLRSQDALPIGGPDYDWPNPGRTTPRIAGTLNSQPLVLGQVQSPFTGALWANPRSILSGARFDPPNLLNTLLGSTHNPFTGAPWANPRSLSSGAVGFNQPNLLATTLGPLSVTPNAQLYWPNPRRAPNIIAQLAQYQGEPFTLASIRTIVFDGIVGSELLSLQPTVIFRPPLATRIWQTDGSAALRSQSNVTTDLSNFTLRLYVQPPATFVGNPDSPAKWIQALAAQRQGQPFVITSLVYAQPPATYVGNPDSPFKWIQALTSQRQGQPFALAAGLPVTFDSRVAGELIFTGVRDNVVVGELLFTARRDGNLPGELAKITRSDVTLNAEELASLRNDTLATGELVSTIRSDGLIPIEGLVSAVAVTSFNLAELLSSVAQDGDATGESLSLSFTVLGEGALSGELITSTPFSTDLAAELLAAQQQDGATSSELLSTSQNLALITGEALTALANDGTLAAEILSSAARYDNTITVELLTAPNLDGANSVELINTLFSDAALPTEFFFGVQLDSSHVAELLQSSEGLGLTPVEIVASIFESGALGVELGTTPTLLLFDNGLAIELRQGVPPEPIIGRATASDQTLYVASTGEIYLFKAVASTEAIDTVTVKIIG